MLTRQQFRKTIFIPAGDVELEGELIVPPGAKTLVIFSHGSGSSRLSPRNNFVAEILHEKRIATFLFDLLTKNEDAVYSTRFDIELLTKRLTEITLHLSAETETKKLKFGYFGASTGAAAAIRAAAEIPQLIHAVVSRGGRPDLAGDALLNVKAPTLLIVGECDTEVLELNRNAIDKMACIKKLEIVERATHLFEEPGTLNRATVLASDWFEKYLE